MKHTERITQHQLKTLAHVAAACMWGRRGFRDWHNDRHVTAQIRLAMSKWIEGKVVGKKRWTERLFSLQVAAPALTFVAGQFARLALPASPGSKEVMLGRPYSFVNPP